MIALPKPLQDSLEKIFQTIPLETLEQASLLLSQHYHSTFALETPEERFAYLATRLPATFAALIFVLQQIDPLKPTHILDLGAGPGTGAWAASTLWPSIHLTSVEKDPLFLSLATQLNSPGQWQQGDFTQQIFPKHDFSLLSYSLGEIEDLACLSKIWEQCERGMILIEPGTPRGFNTILKAREQLVKLGGSLYAPCPHSYLCPLAYTPKWCHFAVRISRSAWHRRCKQGLLSYEDEKFCYIIVTKKPHLTSSRIIDHPQLRKGHLLLSLCTKEGLKKEVVSKRDPELYRKGRKAKWGETWVD